jgi:hypothetical protein
MEAVPRKSLESEGAISSSMLEETWEVPDRKALAEVMGSNQQYPCLKTKEYCSEQ